MTRGRDGGRKTMTRRGEGERAARLQLGEEGWREKDDDKKRRGRDGGRKTMTRGGEGEGRSQEEERETDGGRKTMTRIGEGEMEGERR